MEKKEVFQKSKRIGTEIGEKTNSFLDFFREIDYYFQGRRSAIFIFGAFTIVLFAPLLDFLLQPRRLTLTFVATYLYLLFLVVSFFAWASKFRDEKNKWSFRRFKERIKLSYLIFKETFYEIKRKDNNNKYFIFGIWLFVAGFIIKALQNVSEIFRIPFQDIFGLKMSLLKTFESWTSLGFILVFIGLLIFLYLHFSKRINLFEVFVEESQKPHVVNLNLKNNYVVNLKNREQVSNLIQSNPDSVFRITMKNLLDWKPKYRNLEDEYELDLLKFLKKRLKEEKLSVENQYAIKSGREIGRVDLSINNSIYIEMKRKIKSSELDRASGQIIKYQRILEKTNTPLILLIVDNDYDKIKDKLTDFVRDYNNNHSQKLLSIVVEPNL